MTDRVKTRRKHAEGALLNVYDPLRDFEGGRFEQAVARAALSVRSNIKLTLGVVATIVLLLTALIIFRVWSESDEERSRAAFYELLKNPVFNSNVADPSGAIARLENYEKEYGRSSAQLRSALKKVELYERAGKPREAAASAQIVIDQVDHEDLKLYYSLRAASHLEEAGQYAEALGYYSVVVAGVTEESIFRAMALFGQGRCLVRMGKVEDGKSAIRQMMALKEIEGMDELRILAASYLIER